MLKSFLEKKGDVKEAQNKIIPDRITQKPLSKFMDVGQTYQADLMEFKEDQNLNRYILTFVNTSNGQGDSIPLAIKTGPIITIQTEKFIKSHPDIKFLETDPGSEFINQHFKR